MSINKNYAQNKKHLSEDGQYFEISESLQEIITEALDSLDSEKRSKIWTKFYKVLHNWNVFQPRKIYPCNDIEYDCLIGWYYIPVYEPFGEKHKKYHSWYFIITPEGKIHFDSHPIND